jgi:hydroxymethylglutaryl-CoA lyase
LKKIQKMHQITLNECPRDAMQGIKTFIDTEIKANYLNSLLQVGFDVLDFGSFVSAAAIPQMQDTPQVLKKLNLNNTRTKLLAIVANVRGATDALAFDAISYLGFPFSVSPTFQQRNTNATPAQALERIQDIQNMCVQKNKKLLVYLSMAFGNPYNDAYDAASVAGWVEQLSDMGIKHILFADTIGVSDAANIGFLYSNIVPKFKHIEFGVHLHSTPHTAHTKIVAAHAAGCTWYDAALLGKGGCPMAADALTGNMATESLVAFLIENNALPAHFNIDAFAEAKRIATDVFGRFH